MQVNMDTVQTEHLSLHIVHKKNSKSAMLRSSLIIWCWKALLIILPLLLKIPGIIVEVFAKLNDDRQCVTNCSELSDIVARQRVVKCMRSRRAAADNGRSRRLCGTWSNYTGATILEQLYLSRLRLYQRFNSCTKARHKPAPLIVSCNNRRDSGTVLLREG